METGDVITSVIAGGAIIISIFAFKWARKATEYQILYNLASEYKSVEMLLAVRTLWEFYREIKQKLELEDTLDDKLEPGDIHKIQEKLREEYTKRRKCDKKKIDRAMPSERLKITNDSLHHQRRIVSKYYQFIGAVVKLKIIKRKTIRTHWDERDLRIIPLILLPIDYKLQQENGNTDPENHPALIRMKEFYKKHSGCTRFDYCNPKAD